MKLSLTRAARTDILHQYEYYVDQAPSDVAARFIVAVEETFAQLLTMPTMGTPKQLKNKHLAGLRSWPVKKFEEVRLFYIPKETHLQVIRVLHGRRDIDSIFGN